MKYLHEEFDTVKKIISHTNYAILNISSDHYPTTQAILVEPFYLNAENKLVCFTEEHFPMIMYSHEFQVVLKCINRKKGNFIRMTGLAKFENQPNKKTMSKSVLSIRLLQMAWYYKPTGKVEFYQ